MSSSLACLTAPVPEKLLGCFATFLASSYFKVSSCLSLQSILYVMSTSVSQRKGKNLKKKKNNHRHTVIDSQS